MPVFEQVKVVADMFFKGVSAKLLKLDPHALATSCGAQLQIKNVTKDNMTAPGATTNNTNSSSNALTLECLPDGCVHIFAPQPPPLSSIVAQEFDLPFDEQASAHLFPAEC